MRDHKKRCGITVHQTINESKEQEFDKNKKLGPSCPEFVFKEPLGRKRNKGPPTDFTGKVYLGMLDPLRPFSIFLWYSKRAEDDPEVACVDITVDGKKSPGWVLLNGRKNGICIDKIINRGEAIPFSFSPAKPNNNDNLSFSGCIQATFWRVMKIESSELTDGSPEVLFD